MLIFMIFFTSQGAMVEQEEVLDERVEEEMELISDVYEEELDDSSYHPTSASLASLLEDSNELDSIDVSNCAKNSICQYIYEILYICSY